MDTTVKNSMKSKLYMKILAILMLVLMIFRIN